MLKWPITYTNYNEVEVSEVHHFNLTKAEIMEMEMTTTGGYTDMIRKIIDAKDTPALVTIFKELVLKAYGEKSPDGKHFYKEDENGRPLCNKFKQTEAYSVLFMELATDADKASKFVNGIMPSDMRQASESSAVPTN